MNRREFMAMTGALLASSGVSGMAGAEPRDRPPNVVLIITDDQGYGDLACHGNPHVKTPNLDRLHAESTRLTRFYVSPVCSPTRASLMTGRYNYRTGVVDTFLGRSMMFPDETTLAELLAANGYATGIFGKWHLGDHYPMRAMDQGFQEALVHYGGGIGQPSDPPGSGYFDPILQHNGQEKRYTGYCTDIFTSAAIDFVRQHRTRPFFAYLATNAPHTPLEVMEEAVAPYRAMGLDESTARVYGMITNIDANVGRLLSTLDELGLVEETLVVFLTDNGPQMSEPRYAAGMRDQKGTVYEAGIRVPSFWRWPGALAPGRDVSALSAHIDVVPTILDICGVTPPSGKPMDGVSRLGPLTGRQGSSERTVYLQWHRGDVPEPFRACAAVGSRFKLVDGRELYDLEADPGEARDLAAERPEIVADMRAGYEAWFEAMRTERHFALPRIVVGSDQENPVTLTRQDWRGAEGWSDHHSGYWDLEVATSGRYTITLRFPPREKQASAYLCCGDATVTLQVASSDASVSTELDLTAGPRRLEAFLDHGGRMGPRYVNVRRLV